MKTCCFAIALLLCIARVGNGQSTPGPTASTSVTSSPGECPNVATFTGTVTKGPNGYCFKPDNEPENCQSLTKASLGEDKVAKQIKLDAYAGEVLEVRGQWEHEWVLCAEIMKHTPKK
jgi:hypothetical protein